MDLTADDPTTLGRYRVLGRLGDGAAARVLLGVDATGRRAALEVAQPGLARHPGFRERFRRQVQTAAAAPPWFVAPVLDADPDAELPWVATAHVEGPSLQSYIDANGPLGEQGTLALAVRLADGLVALHGAGLVHGELRPSKVLLAEDGPRLIGLGVPRAAADVGYVRPAAEFRSPEQVAGGQEVGPQTDLFAFGSLVVFAATGRSPFAAAAGGAAGAADPAESADRVLRGEPDLGPLHGQLRAAVLACLSKDPAARPTGLQLRDLLRSLDGADPAVAVTAVIPTAPRPPAPLVAETTAVGPPVMPAPARPAVRPARRWWWRPGLVVAAAVVTAAVVITVALVLGGRQGSGVDPAAAAPTAAPAAPGTAQPTSGPPRTTAAAPGGVTDVATDSRFGTGTARFATPSGNIGCALSPGEVRCDVLQRTWDVPPAPADCPAAYGTGAVLSGTAAGQLTCAGDTVVDPAAEVLGYGEAVRLGSVTCVSRETGLRCEDDATGHGFSVARASYELF